MQCDSLAGDRRICAYREAMVDLAQNVLVRHHQLLDGHDRMATGHRVVNGLQQSLDADCRVREVHQKHGRRYSLAGAGARHDDAYRRSIGPSDECLFAVDDPVVSLSARQGLQH
jgi:hypothetical protein